MFAEGIFSRFETADGIQLGNFRMFQPARRVLTNTPAMGADSRASADDRCRIAATGEGLLTSYP
jgi:hypothetical protein